MAESLDIHIAFANIYTNCIKNKPIINILIAKLLCVK